MSWSTNASLRATAWVALLLLLVQLVAAMPNGNAGAKHFNIHWNSSNSIFRIDNTDNVIDVNRNNLQFEYDQVNLICPVYVPGTRDEDMEKYIIYNVSKDEYETCRITNPNPRIIAVCDKPYKLMYFTITFRPFTPQPGGLEFLPGHDYFFISTSTSDDLHRRIGGRCTTHNMKIVFKVWAPPQESTTRPPSSAARPMQTSPPPARTTAARTTSTTTTAAPTTTKPTKKSKPYDKHPNEVVKSEELTLGSGCTATLPPWPALVVSLLLSSLFAALR